jgi:hypothetical protein
MVSDVEKNSGNAGGKTSLREASSCKGSEGSRGNARGALSHCCRANGRSIRARGRVAGRRPCETVVGAPCGLGRKSASMVRLHGE